MEGCHVQRAWTLLIEKNYRACSATYLLDQEDQRYIELGRDEGHPYYGKPQTLKGYCHFQDFSKQTLIVTVK